MTLFKNKYTASKSIRKPDWDYFGITWAEKMTAVETVLSTVSETAKPAHRFC